MTNNTNQSETFDPNAAASELLIRRELSRRHLLPFITTFNPKYDAGWVHKDICTRLEEFSQAVVRKESPRLMIFLPPRTGKALSHDTVVPTPTGPRTHGQLRVGESVYHPSGKAIKIVAVSEDVPTKVRVTMTSGEEIWCHPNHEWTVFDRHTHKWRTEETSWLLARDTGSEVRFQLPPVDALRKRKKDLPIDPYFLGMWLGDGCKSSPKIASHPDDLEWREDLAYEVRNEYVQEKTGVVYSSFTHQGLMKLFRDLDVYQNKHIPQVYHNSSIAQRLELLAGLIDSDGSVDELSRVRITSVDQVLAYGIYDLVTSLGMRPYMMVTDARVSTTGYVGSGPSYCIGFQPSLNIPTRVPRKEIKRLATQRKLGINEIVVVEESTKVGRCIQVDSDDGMYLVGERPTPTHNSEIASRNFPAWHLGHHPEHEIISCSYASSLAEKFSRAARATVRTPEYNKIFPGFELDESSQSVANWISKSGGGYMAAGVNGPVTGNGMHIGIIDDPVKNDEEAQSENTRESHKDWYTSTFYTRLAPGAGIMVIMTRWHDDDLAGWLLSEEEKGTGDKWELVVYPAIALEDEKYRLKGEALHPARYPIESLRRTEKVLMSQNPRHWFALYQQQPVAEDGEYFTREMLHHYKITDRPPMSEMTIYTAWDLAIGQKQVNDFSVGLTVGIDREERIWLIDLQRGKWDGFELTEKILDVFEQYKSAVTGIERGQIEMALGPFLAKRVLERKLFAFNQEPLKPGRQDKPARARPIQGRMKQGMVLIPDNAPWTHDLVSELLRFPSGKHDDQVDALAWIGQMLNLFYTQPQERLKTESWRDKLPSLMRGNKPTNGAMGA